MSCTVPVCIVLYCIEL